MAINVKRWAVTGMGAALLFLSGIFILKYVDVLLALPLYSWFFEQIQTLGGYPDEVTGALAVWLTATILLSLPTIFTSLRSDKRRAILMVAVGLSLWCVISFLITQPREGYYFNPVTGAARYKFTRLPDGKIELLPLGYRYNPRDGSTLETATPEIIKQYELQRKKISASAEAAPSEDKWAKVAYEPQWILSVDPSDHLSMAIEASRVRINDTVVQVAVRSDSITSNYNLEWPKGAYITDSRGTRYDLKKVEPQNGESTNTYRTVRPYETYRFELYFRRLDYLTPYITVNHHQFKSVKINLNWDS